MTGPAFFCAACGLRTCYGTSSAPTLSWCPARWRTVAVDGLVDLDDRTSGQGVGPSGRRCCGRRADRVGAASGRKPITTRGRSRRWIWWVATL
jgi:hypothetical protein